MIIYINEDRAYSHWVTHHRHGFVLAGNRPPTKQPTTLHRCSCAEVKHSSSKKSHWTTGHHFKACSLDRQELTTWATEQMGHGLFMCSLCQPDQESSPHDATKTGEHHLTALQRQVLSYVLEIATYHLDEPEPPYLLTVGMIGRCLDKTPGQLTAALDELLVDGLITAQGNRRPGEPFTAKARVYPTGVALKSLPELASLDDAQLAVELAKLEYE